ncbi:MAG: aspartate/glutamate racemase family protein, partial [Burkholderiaceae bacterium]
MQPLLGILGGLGPLATVGFLDKITRLTPAKRDQDHLPWLTVSLPGIPDRSHAIQNNNDDPAPFLIQGVSYLASQGVQLIAVPCNTSHFWYEQMQGASSVPILHITDATIEELKLRKSDVKVIAILATRGTIKTGLYSKRLLAHGFKLHELSEAHQSVIDKVIHDVKGGDVKDARLAM